ncbi:MAG: hypothetical protein IKZ04_01030, partial [Spirochaetaceae bacterium]|nr:hypothetical protein [Spirochaetaceae bacterium]
GLTYYSVFKKVYGISMKDAWEDFEKNLEIPSAITDAAAFSGIELFLDDKDFQRYSCLSSSDEKIVFYDKNKRTVFSCKGDNQIEKLLRQSLVRNLTVSPEGRYVTITYMDSDGVHPRYKNTIYDTELNYSYSISEKRLNRGIVFNVKNEGKEKTYFASVYNVSADSCIKIFEVIKNEKDKITGLSFAEKLEIPSGNSIVSLDCDKNGILYFLQKNGMSYSVKKYPVFSSELTEYLMPENMQIQNLSVHTEENKTEIYFSYALPGTMCRLGCLQFENTKNGTDNAVLNLCQNDFSGGMFSPVKTEENNAVYFAEYLNGNKLLKADISKLNFEKIIIEKKSHSSNYPSESDENLSSLENAEKYSGLPYLLKGFWLPFSETNTKTLSENYDSIKHTGSLFGFTFTGSTPWGMPVYSASAGYNIIEKSALFALTVSGGTSTNLFGYTLNAAVELDGKGFKQSYESVNLISQIYLTDKLYLQPEYSAEILFGNITEKNQSQKMFFSQNLIGASLGNVHYVGKGRFEKLGFNLSATLNYVYLSDMFNLKDTVKSYNDVSLGCSFYIPKLLPVEATVSGSYNLPLILSMQLFPNQSYFLEGNGVLVLTSTEIQHSGDLFPILYFNRLNTKLIYKARFSDGQNEAWAIKNFSNYWNSFVKGKMAYFDVLTFRSEWDFTPNLGNLSKIHPSLVFDINYSFFPEPDKQHFTFNLFFSVNL